MADGPRGWLEKGPSASLFVRHVSIQICSSLSPRIQTLLKPTVCLLLMTRCTKPSVDSRLYNRDIGPAFCPWQQTTGDNMAPSRYNRPPLPDTNCLPSGRHQSPPTSASHAP